jgi:hypothetical protein
MGSRLGKVRGMPSFSKAYPVDAIPAMQKARGDHGKGADQNPPPADLVREPYSEKLLAEFPGPCVDTTTTTFV